MAGGDDETGSVGAHGFVFAGQQSDGFPAGRVGAFAYRVELVRLVRAYAADALVHLAEEIFVLRRADRPRFPGHGARLRRRLDHDKRGVRRSVARVRSGGMDYQQDRRAENEALFRTANENIARTAKREQRPATTFICECNRETCLEKVEVAAETYRRVRAKSDQFLLLPGHENHPDENVLESGDGYMIVAKSGSGEDVARRLA